MEPDYFERLEKRYGRRYKAKKRTNILISAGILAIGIPNLISWINRENSGVYIFRWLTFDGTLFTLLGALAFVIINLVEIFARTKLTPPAVYILLFILGIESIFQHFVPKLCLMINRSDS